MPIPPNRVLSESHFGSAWNKMRETGRSLQPLQSPGLRTHDTVHGTIHEIDPAPPAYGEQPAPAASLSLQRFRLQSVASGVLVCRTWDGTTEGTTDTMVALPFKLRPVAYEFIDGRLIVYAYSSNTDRIASSSGIPDEQQNIVPRYLVPRQFTGPGPGFPTITYPGDEIFAAQFETPLLLASGFPVFYQDVNVDARAWAKVYGS